MTTLCRDCAEITVDPSAVCPACGSHRLFSHPELADLSIAHLDCDAFYAAVEKRDNPGLEGKAVIVGGGRRGVVAACCYVARLSGVHSAMPMFKARQRCPDAVVIRPDMAKYQRVGRQVRALMQALTPLVEPLSVDEAFLDLTGTDALHGGPPAQTLVRLVKRVESEIGVSASIGLSYNKFLAKVASDLDKPRGFAAISQSEARAFLSDKPVTMIWGVGRSLARHLKRDGITTIGDLRAYDEDHLMVRYGSMGQRLYRFARGEDGRRVTSGGEAKGVSSETTFDEDIRDPARLRPVMWRLAEKVSARLKNAGLVASGVTLKLKTADFKIITRSRKLPDATYWAEDLYRALLPVLDGEANGRAFRLLGVGAQRLSKVTGALERPPDWLDPGRAKRQEVEAAMDRVRGRFGSGSIRKGREL